MTRQNLAVSAAILAITLIGFFEFPGHAWLQQDTQIWIAIFEHLWNPSVLARDLVATKPHVSYTLTDECAVALRWITHTSFHVALLIMQLTCRILELTGVYLLARALRLRTTMALLVTALFGLGATIVGPAVLTMEYEPVPRGFALGLAFLAMGLAATYFPQEQTELHVWGGQSCPQPAFEPAGPAGKRVRGRDRPPHEFPGFAIAKWHWMAGAIAAAAGTLLHAPTMIPVWIVFLAYAAWRKQFRILLPLLAVALVLFIASRLQIGPAQSQPFFSTIDPEWEQLQRMRASYNWVSTWVNPLFYQYAIFCAVALLACWRIAQRAGRWFTIGLPLIGLAGIGVSYLLTEKAKWALVPQVQPGRAVLFDTAFAVILPAIAGVIAADKHRWWESIAWFIPVFVIPLQPRVFDLTTAHLAIAVGLSVLTSAAVWLSQKPAGWAFAAVASAVPYFAIPILGHIQNYPALHTPELAALTAYASTNTPQDAMFLFPDAGKAQDPGIFRANSLRAIYVDWKSGGQLNYFRSFGVEWWARWQDTMSGKNIPAQLDHYKSLGIDYIVLRRAHSIPGLTPVYENATYLVYRLDAKKESTSGRAGTEACAPMRVTEIAAAAFAKRNASAID